MRRLTHLSRKRLATPLLVLLLMPAAHGTAVAQDAAPRPLPGQYRVPVDYVAAESVAPPGIGVGYPDPSVAASAALPAAQPGYPYLNAPLYPSPQPNIPIQVGATMVTNQAFYPHEMLYPHDYDAIYPPYYHQVKGSFLRTPFGSHSDEKWELLGTKVHVRYRSAIPAAAHFSVPHRRYFSYDKNWSNNP